MKINIPSLYKRYIRIIPGVKSYLLVTIFVFALGVIITLFSWHVERQRLEAQELARLNEQISTIETDLVNRLKIYEHILLGANGLFKASDNVSQAEWQKYTKQFNFENEYPGIYWLGYAEHVGAGELQSYIDNQKKSDSSFKVTPAGTRNEYVLIKYVEPAEASKTQTKGFDLLTDDVRRNTLLAARDSGNISLSRLVQIPPDSDNSFRGFLMYKAVYKEDKPDTRVQKREDLQGYIFAAYNANEFFKKAIDKSHLTTYSEIQVFDGKTTDPQAELYKSEGFSSMQSEHLSQAFTIMALDRNWTIRFAGLNQNGNEDPQGPNMILFGGLTMSLAIAGFLFLVMLTRARQIVYTKQQEAQQAKDDLLSLASHQLRTPATAVKQYLGMIIEGYTGPVSKKQLPALQKAFNSNERQLETINQILYVAKADAGRLSINKTKFDLNFLIDDIALDVSDTLDERGQSLRIVRPRRKLEILADEASIRMVIENLISNASKYSPNGKEVTVTTGLDGNELFIAIKDQGVGIARSDFDKLFKKFSRIENELSLQVGGSGIGLYIDKVLVELHGGRIEVDSKEGEGSTFTVYIPYKGASNLTDGDV